MVGWVGGWMVVPSHPWTVERQGFLEELSEKSIQTFINSCLRGDLSWPHHISLTDRQNKGQKHSAEHETGRRRDGPGV